VLRAADHRRDWPDSVPWAPLHCAAAADPDPRPQAELLRTAPSPSPDARCAPLVLVPHQATRLVRTALMLGDRRRAQTVTAHAATVAARTGTPLWTGVAQHTSGLIQRDPAALREAVALLRQTGARPALEDALLDLARLPRVPAAEADDATAESAALFGRIGAVGDQESAEQVAADLGAARRRRGPNHAQSGFRGVDRP